MVFSFSFFWCGVLFALGFPPSLNVKQCQCVVSWSTCFSCVWRVFFFQLPCLLQCWPQASAGAPKAWVPFCWFARLPTPRAEGVRVLVVLFPWGQIFEKSAAVSWSLFAKNARVMLANASPVKAELCQQGITSTWPSSRGGGSWLKAG
jgi:hypothetical protein